MTNTFISGSRPNYMFVTTPVAKFTCAMFWKLMTNTTSFGLPMSLHFQGFVTRLYGKAFNKFF